MARDFSLESFLKEFGMRIGAAAVVVGIFVGLGYLNRTDLLGLAGPLDTQLGFFGAAFGLVSLVALCWIAIQRRRG